MGNGQSYRGHSEGPNASLEDAIGNAWDNASKDHPPAAAGWFSVHDIRIQTTNPIHAYSVLISSCQPPGPDD
jgi:hypothetical protein